MLTLFALILALSWPRLAPWRQRILNQQLVEALGQADRAAVLKLLHRGAIPHGESGPGALLLSTVPKGPHCLQCQTVLWDDLDIARFVFPALTAETPTYPHYHSPPLLNLAVVGNATAMTAQLLAAGADLEERMIYAHPKRAPVAEGGGTVVMLSLMACYQRERASHSAPPTSPALEERAVAYDQLSGDVVETEVTLARESQYNMQVGNAVVFTLLHDAVVLNNAALLRLLLAHGADPAIRDHTGETPVEYATRLGRDDLAAILASASKAAGREPSGDVE